MKKVRDWLEELPEPFKSRAFSNATPESLEIEKNNLTSALSAAFIWVHSPEGYLYWIEVLKQMNQNGTN